ncbi:hypothetical protein [Paenibacillus odorifer]|uniref:hypothetical protein n=1 Tax=Paenibacillus TaxID=44249 RepID=UPI00096CDF9B|nr:hypothetical protein [Paenibacillus odorifer]OME30920.1 hypothetical protein BSK63_16755 [Paenibacillus odorifer]OME31228.1 hypothetical protein BSK46_25880 [Paenibacillus odorifer]
MTNTGSNSLVLSWLSKPKIINWSIKLGVNTRKSPIVSGSFTTTLSYLDDQGEKWGDTYVKVVGQHYDDYAHWNHVSHLLPIGGITNQLQTFVPSSFRGRQYKDAAPGVTGLIGEVLTTTFLQKEVGLKPFQMAHLKGNVKAPDLCLDIQPSMLIPLIQKAKNSSNKNELLNTLNNSSWHDPFPIECKSRRDKGNRQIRDALNQLISYWGKVTSMAGFGVIAQIDVIPTTNINLHLIIPKATELINVQKIILGDVRGTNLTPLPINPTISQFNSLLGGRIIG